MFGFGSKYAKKEDLMQQAEGMSNLLHFAGKAHFFNVKVKNKLSATARSEGVDSIIKETARIIEYYVDLVDYILAGNRVTKNSVSGMYKIMNDDQDYLEKLEQYVCEQNDMEAAWNAWDDLSAETQVTYTRMVAAGIDINQLMNMED